jgi:hypothetical protein
MLQMFSHSLLPGHDSLSFLTGPQLATYRLCLTESRSQSYVMTDGQLASLSSCQGSIWGPKPDFCYCQTVAGLLMWGALSDERTGLSFTIAAGLRQGSHSQVLVPRDSRPYFTISDSRLPQTWRARSPYLSPRNRVALLYPQALGSLFATSYDWQGYGGGIRTHFHTGFLTERSGYCSLCNLGADRVENAASNSSCIFACICSAVVASLLAVP